MLWLELKYVLVEMIRESARKTNIVSEELEIDRLDGLLQVQLDRFAIHREFPPDKVECVVDLAVDTDHVVGIDLCDAITASSLLVQLAFEATTRISPCVLKNVRLRSPPVSGILAKKVTRRTFCLLAGRSISSNFQASHTRVARPRITSDLAKASPW